MYQIQFDQPIHIHFMGIGGISMSGLAELLLSKGFTVSGSDMKQSVLTDKLEALGAKIMIGQRRDNITDDIDCMVYTSAIHPDNPEFAAVQEKGIAMLSRAQLLGQVMKNYALPVAVSGTHGKTTTTSMLSEMLLAAGEDPTLSIGGMLQSIGGNFRIGGGDVFVTEACEYTNSFLSFFPNIGIILNVEEDHLDFFKDLADIRDSFHRFANLLPEGGHLVINGEISDYEELTKDLSCKVTTFGFSDTNDYYPADISYDEKACAEFTLQRKGESVFRVKLGVPGAHNIGNALAAIAAGDLLGLPALKMAKALGEFKGTDRRFEYKGTIGGVTVVDDYAHHPTEIKATLTAAKNYPHKHLWCVFQPHTYTRTKAFLEDFADALSLAENVVLAEIYAARETDTLGVSSKTLQEAILAKGHPCKCFASFDEIENFLLENCTEGDLLITMGAGDVYKVGENILGI